MKLTNPGLPTSSKELAEAIAEVPAVSGTSTGTSDDVSVFVDDLSMQRSCSMSQPKNRAILRREHTKGAGLLILEIHLVCVTYVL